VHLGLRESHRREQLRLLCDVVAHEVRTARRSWSLAISTTGAHAGMRASPPADCTKSSWRRMGAWPAPFPPAGRCSPVDRIYVRNLRASRPTILSTRPWSHLSDHAPLAVEIAW
jgi:endonuclease/exonuclease/phosphatase family metal-dependent hydrolase